MFWSLFLYVTAVTVSVCVSDMTAFMRVVSGLCMVACVPEMEQFNVSFVCGVFVCLCFVCGV